jgi:hypothetical protein
MKDLIIFGLGLGLGYWLKSSSAEREALRKENELLKARNKE